MKQTEMERLEKDLKESKDLQAKWEEAIETASKSGVESDGEAMVKAAESFGYTIDIAELEKVAAKAQELSEEELSQTVGGTSGRGEDEYGHDNTCVTAWHCCLVTCHTETEDKRATCFSDYVCAYIFKDPVAAKRH